MKHGDRYVPKKIPGHVLGYWGILDCQEDEFVDEATAFDGLQLRRFKHQESAQFAADLLNAEEEGDS